MIVNIRHPDGLHIFFREVASAKISWHLFDVGVCPDHWVAFSGALFGGGAVPEFFIQGLVRLRVHQFLDLIPCVSKGSGFN